MLAPNPISPAPIEPASVPKWHDVTVVCKTKYECAKVCGVAPEEFGIAKNARTIRDAGYVFHEMVDKSEADLIDQGYDRECIEKLPDYVSVTSIEASSRDTVEEHQSSGDDGLNKANRLVKITEHYVRMDYEGNGKHALYRVTTGGDDGVILTRDGEDDVVEVDHICFAAMTPVPITHRFFGRSVADLVMDIQRIKTAILRGGLDNLYLHNNPRVEVAETHANENTLDDLLVSRPGGIVRTKMPGGLNAFEHPDITSSIFPMLQYMDSLREWRTGVTRQGQGVDPEALQNQVATIANQMADAAQAKVKLIARIFAETGIRDLFSLLHATIRRHGSQPQTVRLRNKWVEVDPREWKSRDDMTVKVGLGDGSKQAQLAGTQLLIGAQEKAIQAGLVSKKNLFNSAKQLTKLLGHKDPEEYFTAPGQQADPKDPDSAPIQPLPDPKMAEMQNKQELAKLQAQNDMAKLQASNEIEKTQAQADIATQQLKTQADIALAEKKFQLESRLAMEKHALEMEKIRAEMAKHVMELQAKQAEQQASLVHDEQKHSMGMEHSKQAHEQTLEQKKAEAKIAQSTAVRKRSVKTPSGKTYEMTES